MRNALLIALCVATAALVLVHRYLPLVDWPEHLAQDAIVARLDDPSFGVARYYRTTGWFLPYQGFRWLHIALAAPFGLALGGRIALALALVSMPLAVSALMKRFGRDPWLAFGAFILVVDGNVLWGFAPYALAVSMSLGALALAIDYGRFGGRWRAAALLLAGIAIFFTHSQQTAVYLASLGALTAVAWQRRAIGTRRALHLLVIAAVPAALLALFLFASGWLSGAALSDPFAIAPPTEWRAPRATLRMLPFSAGLTVAGRAPWIGYLCALVAVSLGGVVQRWWRRTDLARRIPRGADPWTFAAPTLALVWIALAFALPAEFRGQTLAPRLASAALLGAMWLTPLAAPRSLREVRLAAFVRAALTASAFVTLSALHLRFAAYDRSLSPLDAAIARVPPGARVATLAYETRGSGMRLPVYLHLGGYVLAARGGMAAAGFTRTGVTYREAVPRDALLVNELWMPSRLGTQLDLARFGPHYDRVLVWRGGMYPGSPFVANETAQWSATRVMAEGGLELWTIRARVL